MFLYVAGFFDSWDGKAVGVLAPRTEEPKVYEVVVAQGDGDVIERPIPSYAVLAMQLPVLAYGVPPDPIPDDALRTRKARFQLSYMVQTRAEGATTDTWVRLPTTTPQAVGLAVIIWIIALAIRNMAYAGSPFWLERQRAFLPKAQTQAGSVAETRSRGRKGAPPPRPQRGPRRR